MQRAKQSPLQAIADSQTPSFRQPSEDNRFGRADSVFGQGDAQLEVLGVVGESTAPFAAGVDRNDGGCELRGSQSGMPVQVGVQAATATDALQQQQHHLQQARPATAPPSAKADVDDDDRPLKRAKPSKVPPQVFSRPIAAQATQGPQLQGQAASAKATVATGAAALAAAHTKHACAPGSEVSRSKSSSLSENHRGHLNNAGRCTQVINSQPLADAQQRGHKKPASAATAAASGAVTVRADKQLDPALSAFDDLNSPPQKVGVAPWPRAQAATKQAGSMPSTATAKVGLMGNVGGRPQTAYSTSGAGSAPVGGVGGVAAARGESKGARAFGATAAAARVRLMSGQVPAARTKTPIFDIKQVSRVLLHAKVIRCARGSRLAYICAVRCFESLQNSTCGLPVNGW